MTKYTIENAAGGNKKEFAWNAAKGMSLVALRHAVACGGFGGPVFGGECADAARAEFDEINRQYTDGECTETVAKIFQS